MQLKVALSCLLITPIIANILPYLEDEESPDYKWQIPQLDGSFRWMTEDQARLDNYAFNASDPKWDNFKNFLKYHRKQKKVRFFLYTKANPLLKHELNVGDVESLESSNFNKSNPTRLMVHGWMGGLRAPQNNQITDAFLQNGRRENYNVIIVDWSVYALTVNYYAASLRTRRAGGEVAAFIDWLHDATGMPFATLHLMGHSLGAHVVGFAGKSVKRGRIHTIVGLDTAMPLFRFKNPQNRLADTDAEYVETIHTNGRRQGFYNPIGMASFYPNGGKSQPGCGLDLHGSCAHWRVVNLYAEAMAMGEARNAFTATKCADFEALKAGNCSGHTDGIQLGSPHNCHRARGVFYLETNAIAPFAKG